MLVVVYLFRNALSYAIVTTYELLSYMLVSPLDPKPEVITAVIAL